MPPKPKQAAALAAPERGTVVADKGAGVSEPSQPLAHLSLPKSGGSDEKQSASLPAVPDAPDSADSTSITLAATTTGATAPSCANNDEQNAGSVVDDKPIPLVSIAVVPESLATNTPIEDDGQDTKPDKQPEGMQILDEDTKASPDRPGSELNASRTSVTQLTTVPSGPGCLPKLIYPPEPVKSPAQSSAPPIPSEFGRSRQLTSFSPQPHKPSEAPDGASVPPDLLASPQLLSPALPDKPSASNTQTSVGAPVQTSSIVSSGAESESKAAQDCDAMAIDNKAGPGQSPEANPITAGGDHMHVCEADASGARSISWYPPVLPPAIGISEPVPALTITASAPEDPSAVSTAPHASCLGTQAGSLEDREGSVPAGHASGSSSLAPGLDASKSVGEGGINPNQNESPQAAQTAPSPNPASSYARASAEIAERAVGTGSGALDSKASVGIISAGSSTAAVNEPGSAPGPGAPLDPSGGQSRPQVIAPQVVSSDGPNAAESSALQPGRLAPAVNYATVNVEASAKLEDLRREARKLGEVEYMRGPGAKRPRPEPGMEAEVRDPVLAKKDKKSQSAYVSRFAAKEYERLLVQAVSSADEFLNTERSQNVAMRQDNADMREQVAALEAVLRSGLATLKNRVGGNTKRENASTGTPGTANRML